MHTRTKFYLCLAVFMGLTSCGAFEVKEESTHNPETQFWLYDSITFEIAPIGTGAMPLAVDLETFRERLHENRLCRRSEVRFIIDDPVGPTTLHMWEHNGVHYYEQAHRRMVDRRPDDKHLIVFVAYVLGPFLEGGEVKVLGGIQYSPTAFMIFKDGAIGREAGVMLHEFGHIIGLVKNQTRDNHDDGHQNHCANKRCAMFWSAPSNDADFDYYCKQDIQRRLLQRLRGM